MLLGVELSHCLRLRYASRGIHDVLGETALRLFILPLATRAGVLARHVCGVLHTPRSRKSPDADVSTLSA